MPTPPIEDLEEILRALQFTQWIDAWRQIGWHAQIDLRMNQRDLRHRMPWSEWITCERCHVRARKQRCKHCARDLCGPCMPSACPNNKEKHE